MNSPLLGAVVLETLIACGVTDVVLSPGSRNAPLSLAAHAADTEQRVRLHVRVDERVAAFTALGLAKASGRVVAVATTSGTAVANLAPAAMEARAAGIGLLLITADRPGELIGTGANQTARQPGVFGATTLEVIRLSSSSGSLRRWSAAVQRAHALAAGTRTRQKGPVQVNIEFTPPLVAQPPRVEINPTQVAPTGRGPATELDAAPTVCLVGDASPELGRAARTTAELAGAPLLAEPSSNARAGHNAIAGYRLLLDTPLAGRIRRVVCFGHPTLSRPVARLLAREDVELVVVTDGAEWHDISANADIVTEAVHLDRQAPGWLDEWRAADATRPATEFGGRAIAAAVIASVGRNGNLFLGSSQTIRDADLAPIVPEPGTVYSNRGASGIDGTLATATGVALATGRPTTVLLGDLTLQHDLGALVAPPLEPAAELRVVVVDDDGGAIFHTLEQGAPEYQTYFERVFGTPQGLDLAAVGAAMGWQVRTATDLASLQEALAGPVRGRQLVVCPTGRAGRRAEALGEIRG